MWPSSLIQKGGYHVLVRHFFTSFTIASNGRYKDFQLAIQVCFPRFFGQDFVMKDQERKFQVKKHWINS